MMSWFCVENAYKIIFNYALNNGIEKDIYFFLIGSYSYMNNREDQGSVKAFKSTNDDNVNNR